MPPRNSTRVSVIVRDKCGVDSNLGMGVEERLVPWRPRFQEWKRQTWTVSLPKRMWVTHACLDPAPSLISQTLGHLHAPSHTHQKAQD